MKRFIRCASLLCAATAVTAGLMGATPYDWEREVRSLASVQELPLYRTGCYVEEITTYDPTEGNDDGFSGKYSYIRKENGKLVLAELTGPGVINRIHTPTPTRDTISFYFDGEKTPRLSLPFIDLFSGKTYPFVKPICDNEVGGYFCYVPIPYAKSCKVVFHGEMIQFHQIQYRNLPGNKVESYTAAGAEKLRDAIEAAGNGWDKPTVPSGCEITESSHTLQPGAEVTLFETSDPGRILGLEIDGGIAFDGLNKDVILSAVWDGEAVEAIYAPLADFFGYAYGKGAMRGIFAGKAGDVNYFYLPCPFDKSAKVKLIYKTRPGAKQNPIQLTAKVYHNDIKRSPKSEGKLYTVWNREIDPEKGKFYTFADIKGRGHYVGTIHIAQGLIPGMTLFFEGDDLVTVDGKMRIHGTGSEDAFNGGWYALMDRWDRGVSLPLHGSLDYSLPLSRTGAYRFLTTDKMTFEKELYFCIEHGPERNEFPVDYASVAFYYADRGPGSRKEPTEELRTVHIPSKHTYYPQLMDFTLTWGTELTLRNLVRVRVPEGQGKVRIALGELPEGRYKIFLTYTKGPGNADFCLLQRQKQIAPWRSTSAQEWAVIEKEPVGEMMITPQTNTLTIQVRKSDQADVFEFGNLFLERITD